MCKNKECRNSKDFQIPKHINKNMVVCKRIAKIDSCIYNLIHILNYNKIKTVGCCCGHNKYNMTIIHESPNGKHWELISGIEIPRKRRFYLKDKEGFYYIPEVK